MYCGKGTVKVWCTHNVQQRSKEALKKDIITASNKQFEWSLNKAVYFVWVCVHVFFFKYCKELYTSNRFVEFTSPTATPAVLMWLCRGLSFPVCLPFYLNGTLKQKRSHFLLFAFFLAHSFLWLLQLTLYFSLTLWSIKFDPVPPPLLSLACCSSHLSLTFTFFFGCWHRDHKLSLLHPAGIIPTATNKYPHKTSFMCVT